MRIRASGSQTLKASGGSRIGKPSETQPGFAFFSSLSVCRLDSFFFRSLASLPLLLDHAKDVAAQSSVLAI